MREFGKSLYSEAVDGKLDEDTHKQGFPVSKFDMGKWRWLAICRKRESTRVNSVMEEEEKEEEEEKLDNR